jgi:hypothetical protein
LFRLKKWWREVFPDLQLHDHGVQHCPMLMGLMRLAPQEETGFFPAGYQCQVLQCCDCLPRTRQRSTIENVLETLNAYKQEWHRLQPFLVPFDVCQLTGLCPDVLVEISEYLWLNDAINAFSIGILPLLHRAHLNNPLKQFVELIPRHLDPRQVVSLHLSDDFRSPRNDLSTFHIFDQLISLTIIGKRATYMIDRWLNSLPNVRRLSIWLDEKRITHLFHQLIKLSYFQITHLHVRCAGDFYSYSAAENQQRLVMKNTTIISFIFDSEYYPWYLDEQQRSIDLARFMNVASRYIQSLVNVQRVRLITNCYYIGAILRAPHWQQALSQCVHLSRVIVEMKGHGDFKQEAMNMEQTLRQFRPGMIFRIKTL